MQSMFRAPCARRAGIRATFTAAALLASGVTFNAMAQTPAPTQPTQPTPTQPAPTDPSQPVQPAQPGQEAPAAPTPPQLTFDTDYVIWFYAVKGENSADFERFFGRVKEAMVKSDRMERRQQAQGMKLLKSTASAPDGTMTYVLLINPVTKGQEYSPGMLLFEVFPSEAKALVDELQGYINEKGLNAAVPMNTVLELGGM